MSKTLATVVLSCFLFVACSGGAPSNFDTTFDEPVSNQTELHEEDEHDHEHVHVGEDDATAPLEVVLVTSELIVGPNRFAVGLFDGERQVVHDADVHFHYFDLSDPSAPALESEANARALQTPDGSTTIFTHEREFSRAGDWGVEVQARFPDGTAALKRIGFEVVAESPTVKPGQTVPAFDTPTAASAGGDLSTITSAFEVNPAFYEQSLAGALSSGKPTVLLFATPAFCQTRFCGPAYEQLGDMYARYGQDVNFIHVEVYTGLPDPSTNNWEIAPSMTAFGLTTEPWLYLIDANGTVAYRVEGIFTAAEVEPHLQALASG